MDFDNLHQVLRNLYQEMMPLCGDMIGVAKGIAGLSITALGFPPLYSERTARIPQESGRCSWAGRVVCSPQILSLIHI